LPAENAHPKSWLDKLDANRAPEGVLAERRALAQERLALLSKIPFVLPSVSSVAHYILQVYGYDPSETSAAQMSQIDRHRLVMHCLADDLLVSTAYNEVGKPLAAHYPAPEDCQEYRYFGHPWPACLSLLGKLSKKALGTDCSRTASNTEVLSRFSDNILVVPAVINYSPEGIVINQAEKFVAPYGADHERCRTIYFRWPYLMPGRESEA
jgi:hypothetical protein